MRRLTTGDLAEGDPTEGDLAEGRRTGRRRPGARRTAWCAATTLGATLLVAAVASCGTTAEGVRVEQSAAASAGPQGRASPLPAATVTPSEPTPSESGSGTKEPDEKQSPSEEASPSPSWSAPEVSPPGARRTLDVITLVRHDPKVSSEVKESLVPCAGQWPVDVAYGRLTGASASDVIVNVTSCADGKGLGSYVYRESRGNYVNVFAEEEAAVYAQIDKSALRVDQQIYLEGDPLCCPTGQDVVTYMWRGGKFAEMDRVYKDYPKPTDEGRDGGEG